MWQLEEYSAKYLLQSLYCWCRWWILLEHGSTDLIGEIPRKWEKYLNILFKLKAAQASQKIWDLISLIIAFHFSLRELWKAQSHLFKLTGTVVPVPGYNYYSPFFKIFLRTYELLNNYKINFAWYKIFFFKK